MQGEVSNVVFVGSVCFFAPTYLFRSSAAVPEVYLSPLDTALAELVPFSAEVVVSGDGATTRITCPTHVWSFSSFPDTVL